MEVPRACFVYKGPESLAKDTLLPGRDQLVDILLEEYGIKSVFSSDSEASFHIGIDGVAVDSYQFAPSSESEVPVAERLLVGSDIDVILNRRGRSLQLAPEVRSLVPMFNSNEVRGMGHYKYRAHERVLEPLGIAMPTALVKTPDDAYIFMTEECASRDYIVKPEIGHGTKGVERLSAPEVFARLAENPGWLGRYLLQPAYDLTKPFPKEIKAFDSDSKDAFDAANESGKAKEIRMYGFHAGGETKTFPVARVVDNGDHWFVVDPDSVPELLHQKTQESMDLVARLTGVKAVQGTCDWAFGTHDSQDPHWAVVEANLRSPYVYNQHSEVSRLLHGEFASQIAVAAGVRL